MTKTILTAACALALFSTTALAQTAAPATGAEQPLPQIRAEPTPATPGAAAGAAEMAPTPQCEGLATEQEVTRCLNLHMAELAERGIDADQSMRQ